MATFQQVQRFMEPPQQQLTLRQRQQRQLQGLTSGSVAPPTAQNYRQIMGADSFGNSRAGAMEANRAAGAMRAMREPQPTRMEQAELNSLRERGGVPPDMEPRQGNAPGGSMIAGVDISTSPVLGARWATNITADNAAGGALPIQRSNPGARRVAQAGRASFAGRSSSISRSNPVYTPPTNFGRYFPR